MKVNAAMADDFARLARHSRPWTQELLRDWLDQKTDGELSYHALNILTHMVWNRIQEQPTPGVSK